MTTTTISGSVTNIVTLGASYEYGDGPATLIITNAGTLATGTAASALAVATAGGYPVPFSVTNNGLIAGNIALSANTGQVLNNGTITGQYEAFNATTLLNSATGLIQGGATGVSGSAILNSGLIGGTTAGAYMVGNFSLNNSGTITGGTTGVIAASNGTIVDSGLISGSSYAIFDRQGTLGLTLTPGAALYGAVTVAGGIVVLEDALPGVNTATLHGFDQIEYTTSGSVTGLINSGTFTQSNAAGVSLAVGGTVTNSGTITASGTYQAQFGLYSRTVERHGGTGIVSGGPVSIDNSGQIVGLETGISLAAGGSVLNAGIIAATGSYYRYSYNYSLGGGTPAHHPTITHGPGVALYNATGALTLDITPEGEFIGTVVDAAHTGSLELGTGTLGNSGTLNMAGFSGFDQIEFASGTQWTLEAQSSQLTTSENISGFQSGDTIILDGLSATGGAFYPGLGLVLNTGTSIPMLHFTGSYSSGAFSISAANGNTTITAACFVRGTRIATPAGEVPIEELSIGDEVATLHAGPKRIKWIGRRSYAAPFANGDFIRPLRIHPGALGEDIPKRVLGISPGHALFVGGALIPAWRLLNGASVTQAAHVELVEYFHVELDAQEVIFAEACPVESFIGADLRGQFHNIADFLTLYPNHAEQSPCLPLLEDGFALEALKAHVAARAGLPPAPPAALGPLRGFVDLAGPDNVEGWAQDEAAPEQPVTLDVLRAGIRVGRVLANRFRADLREAGMGSGCHAFRFALPPGMGEIEVRRTGDGAVLPLTEAAIRVA